MIIMIILLTVAIAGTVICILRRRTEWGPYDIEEDGVFIGTLIPTILAIGASVICGGICIGVNQPSAIASTGYALNERVNLFRAEKETLESFRPVTDGSGKTGFTSDITFETLSTEAYYEKVNDYNKKVYKFKCEVKGNQFAKDNPWVSWFVSAGYKAVSDWALDQLEYTPGR